MPDGFSFPPSHQSRSNMGLPSSQTSLSVSATLSDPDRPSGVSPFTTPLYWLPLIIQCHRLLNNLTRLNCFRDGAYIPYCPHSSLCTLTLCRSASSPPSQRQHSVRVVSYSLPGKDSHLTRDAKLRLAHMIVFW